MGTDPLAGVGLGTPADEKARLDALDPDAADDRLDALLAQGWKLDLGSHDYMLIPPLSAGLGVLPGGGSPGGARGLG